MIRIYNPWADQRIRWWEKLVLWFIPEKKFETPEDEITTILYYKIWKGKIYITDVVSSFTMDIVLDTSKL